MRVDGLRAYTKYEFSVMITKGHRMSIYSLAARNTTLEASKCSVRAIITLCQIIVLPQISLRGEIICNESLVYI